MQQTNDTHILFTLGETAILCKRPYADALHDYVDSLPRKRVRGKHQMQDKTLPNSPQDLRPVNTL